MVECGQLTDTPAQDPVSRAAPVAGHCDRLAVIATAVGVLFAPAIVSAVRPLAQNHISATVAFTWLIDLNAFSLADIGSSWTLSPGIRT